MNVLLCIGNEQKKDDGLGPYVAKAIQLPDWEVIDAGTVPEKYTGDIKRERPEYLVIVDAADMGLRAGTTRVVPTDKIVQVGISTHSLPLSVMIDYISEHVGQTIVIGVQPKVTSLGEGMSRSVKKAGMRLIKVLEELDRKKKLEKLEQRLEKLLKVLDLPEVKENIL